MITTKKKILLLLINTKDHSTTKRSILMRVSYRKDFSAVYQDLLDLGIIEEQGDGKKGNTRQVRLLDTKALEY